MILNCFYKIDDAVFGGEKPVTSASLEELSKLNNLDEVGGA
jgi:hypothetical protein